MSDLFDHCRRLLGPSDAKIDALLPLAGLGRWILERVSLDCESGPRCRRVHRIGAVTENERRR